jgi:hypothetical protein
MSRSEVAVRFTMFAGTLASLCCGGQRAPATGAPVDASVVGGPSILWTYGQGADITDVVQSRSGTLYVAMGLHGDADLPGIVDIPTPAVAALDPLGHERWRVIVPDRSVYMVICNGSGDVWAFGAGVTRISSSGTVVWHLNSDGGGGARAAVDAHGEVYVYSSTAANLEVRLRAIAPDGTPMWIVPVGGTWSSYESVPDIFGPPAIASSGIVYVPHLNGEAGVIPVVEGLDPTTGSIVTSAASVPDAAVPWVGSNGVVIDADGNLYFEAGGSTGGGLTSVQSDGTWRWTNSVRVNRAAPVLWLSPQWGGDAPPVLIGADALVASVAPGLVELAPADGRVTAEIPVASPVAVTVPNGPALLELLAGGYRVAAMQLHASSSPASGGYSDASFGSVSLGAAPTLISVGTILVDRAGKIVWNDPELIAASVIPGRGVVYGIRDGQLVAEVAPMVTGLDPGAWPMVAHDPGRTSSSDGAW